MKKLFKVLSFLLVFVLFLTSCKSTVNGTFEGKARGHNGDVVIDVSFENNKIKKVELKKLLLKMKNVNKIEEIKKLYDEFILIRRLGYV